MNSRLVLVLLVLSQFTIGATKEHQTGINFKHLTINDGLSQNAVFAILQDRHGFMWFGTKDGLNRYDGYSFRVFRNNPFDSTSLSSSYITTLLEDSRGRLWVGTHNGGLNRLDRDSETFIRFIHDSANPHSLSSNEITAIAEDSRGNIWVGTHGGGVSKLPEDELENTTPAFVRYLSDAATPSHLSHNMVNALLFDRNGTGWVGTDAGLDKLESSGDAVRFTHYPIITKNRAAPASPGDNSVTALLEDRSGNLWLGCPSGLTRFHRNSGSTVNHPHHYEIYRYGWGTVTGILEDRSGYFWLATPGELMRFDPKSHAYNYFRHDPLNPLSLSDNSASSLWQDQSGILWVGTSGYGLNTYDPKTERFQTLRRAKDASSRIAGFSVRAILEDHEGNVWISTGVLYEWNRKTGELKSFEGDSKQPDRFGNTGAWSMIQDHKGRIWLATNQGLYRYEPHSGNIRQYKCEPADTSGLREKVVYAVFEDIDGKIWVATDSYFSRLSDERDGRFTHYRYNYNAPDTDPAFPTIFQDIRGRFWLGTRNGLLRFQPERKSFVAYTYDPRQPTGISNNVVRSICADPKEPERFLWLGTHGGGLNRLDMATGIFTHFTTRDGLPNDVVYGVLADHLGNLWMSTNKGLSRFNPQTGEIKNYEASDGLQSNEFNSGAYYKSRSGELFFGGIDGLNYFNPSRLSDNPHVPHVVITGFRILNKEVYPTDKNAVLKKVILQTRDITLSYRDDVITFQFAALDFSAPFRNRYAYKMEGFNTDWIQAGTGRTATFTNLPPGDYVFRVIGSNNDGIWNREGASLNIHVTSPPWKTGWAYLLYGLSALGLLYGLRSYEMNRLRWKNRLQMERVEGEKLRDIDQLKSRFFANISHEFRTPLTLIVGPLQQLMEKLPDEESQRMVGMMQRNARRLLQLINQLLDLSKLDAGKMELYLRQGDFVAFLRGLLTSYDALAETKQIDVCFGTERESFIMLFDHDKMENIFHNLLSNAFKFTAEGGAVSLSVAFPEGPPNPASVVVTLADNGAGIPAHHIAHVFDRFFQVDELGGEGGGSGIGLALVKELVELQRGEISVQSRVGEGTTFTVTLPVERAEVVLTEGQAKGMLTDLDQETPAENTIDREDGDENGGIVLVIEDNLDMRAFIRTVLSEDYEVVEAGDGREGVEKAAEAIPDLIISDLMLPKMDGYEVCRVLKNDQKTSHIPIILLTARAAAEDKLNGLQAGADDYLIKPFRSDELVARVTNLIAVRKNLIASLGKKALLSPSELAVTSVDQAFLENVRQVVEREMGDESFGVETLCAEIAMSERQFRRKLKALTGETPTQVIRSMRLQRARHLLEQNAATIAEVAFQVGFGSPAYFTKSFRETFGVLPSEVVQEK